MNILFRFALALLAAGYPYMAAILVVAIAIRLVRPIRLTEARYSYQSSSTKYSFIAAAPWPAKKVYHLATAASALLLLPGDNVLRPSALVCSVLSCRILPRLAKSTDTRTDTK